MDAGGETTSDIRTVYAAVSGHPNLEPTRLLCFKVYKRRWFVLLVLCLLNCSNATVSHFIHCLYDFLCLWRTTLPNSGFVWQHSSVNNTYCSSCDNAEYYWELLKVEGFISWTKKSYCVIIFLYHILKPDPITMLLNWLRLWSSFTDIH